MSEIVPVSRERHGNRAWNKSAGFSWMREQLVALITLKEATTLMMNLPVAFMRSGESFELVILLGVRTGENVCVSDDGRWLAPRKPAALQHYPFRLIRMPDGNELLGVDESALLPPDTVGGTPLFGADGKPSSELNALVEQLSRAAAERNQTRPAIDQLRHYDLLEPWPIRVEDTDGVSTVDGLFRINETKLNSLEDITVVALHKSNALILAHVQLLSMVHLQDLGKLAASRAAARKQAAKSNPGDDEHGLISFSNL